MFKSHHSSSGRALVKAAVDFGHCCGDEEIRDDTLAVAVPSRLRVCGAGSSRPGRNRGPEYSLERKYPDAYYCRAIDLNYRPDLAGCERVRCKNKAQSDGYCCIKLHKAQRPAIGR